jgi:alkylation response protein AidB-like acyl-CoA dehydrogenase
MVSTIEAVCEAAREHAGHGEQHRSLAPEVVGAAKAAGLFCLGLPTSLGGLGGTPADCVDAVERVAHADGAAGWCAFIGNATSFYGWLDPEVARDQLAGAPGVAASSIFGPMGVAVPDGSGSFRVEGRWGFASGCLHSELVQVGVMVMDGEAPALRPDGNVDWRFAYLTADEVEVVDTWDTMGLRGTGSNDVVVSGVLVPQERFAMPMFDPPKVDDPIFRFGFWGLLPVLMTPFMLGVARRALDELEEVLRNEPERPGRARTGTDPQVHHELGRARAALSAAQAGLDDAVGTAWDSILGGRTAGQAEHDRLALAMHHGLATSLDAADVAYRFGPSGVVRHGDPIQRCFRDLHTARKHVAFGLDGYRGTSRRALGLE